MSKMLKRTVAGLLAAGLLVSSVGIDDIIADLSGIMMTSVAVDVASKQGSDKDFNNLEQDTKGSGDSKIYNTNYGLHTDKTVAQAYPDGRTFDLDLESWYIGEKPADVGMVLDASGSMAWTTENIDPYKVEDKVFEDIKNSWGDKDDLYIDSKTGLLTTAGEELVLDKNLVDDSCLSYVDYHYYIYDDKSATSEFVPLGYWDGSLITDTFDPIEELKSTWKDSELIGFYPFAKRTDSSGKEGSSLQNQVNTDSSQNIKAIDKSSDTNMYTTNAYTGKNDFGTSSGNSLVTEDKNAAWDSSKSGYSDTFGGFMLGAKPTIETDESYNFTISFSIHSKESNPTSQENTYLFVGPLGTDLSDKNYCLFNSAKTAKRFGFHTVSSTVDKSVTDGNTQGEISKSSKKFVTVVCSSEGDGKVSLYFNGVHKNTESFKLSTENLGIIFCPSLKDNIYLDDIYLFDTALNADDVKTLYENAQKQKVQITTETLSDRAVRSATSKRDDVLATIDKNLAAASAENRKGWYYVNSHSDWDCLNDPEIGTGKQFIGLQDESGSTDGEGNLNYATDKRPEGSKTTEPRNYGTLPETPETFEWLEKSQGDLFDSAVNGITERTSIKFFIDDNGYLKCIFNTGNPIRKNNGNMEINTQTSFVYFKPNDVKIKTEALDDAVNGFIDALQNDSQQSNVSAVRFSLSGMIHGQWGGEDKTGGSSRWFADYNDTEADNKIAEGATGSDILKQLVLLDWTDGTATKDISISRPAPDNSAEETDLEQYNYFLTGGTYTWTGLASFYYELAKTSDNPKKYLILFTDGKDNMISGTVNDGVVTGITGTNAAEYWAGKLKDEGYTIFCVVFSGGSVDESTDDFAVTKKYLSEFVASQDEKGQPYFYSAKSSDELATAFTSILNQIKKPLTNYTVQDYIDPRFDLIDYTTDKENGTVLHLGAGGKVSDKTLTDAYAAAPTSCDYTTKDGKTAKLYYDSDKDMYYLRWNDVAIPGYTRPFEGDSQTETEGVFDVWSSTITVKAKDDFIGGNAVLTNGNEAGMNLVFNEHSIKDEADKKAALTDLSGTDKANDQGKGDGFFPSKGFPRTTVNVRLLDIETKDLNDVIYLGEVVSPTIMLADLENDYLTGSYYLEYLERYAYRLYGASAESTPLIELLNEWLQIYNDDVNVKSFTIPYIYLPDPKYDGNKIEMVGGKPVVENNAGTPLNQLDILGYLTYTWETKDDLTEYGRTLVTDEFVASKPGQIKYQLSLEYTPLHEDTISSPSFTDPLDGAQFIPDDEVYFKPSGDNFNISENKNDIATNYDNVTVDTDTKWTFTNRQDYLRAIVNENHTYNDTSGTEVTDNNVYEWDKDYKPTKGREQIVRAHQYGDATKENDFYTLTANTTYTKDVVNAALALKLIVKGSDLNGGNIVENNKYTFTAKRNYKDELDPVYYLAPEKNMNANATDEEYTLTFTVGEIPAVTNVGEYYTIWATLSDIQKEGTSIDPLSLPIGTYKITANMNNGAFVVNSTDPAHIAKFDHLITDTDPANYKQELFPEAVTKESDSHTVYNNEYTIYDGTNDRSGENIANTKEENGTGSERTVTFYFGTKNDDGERGTRKVEDPDTKEEYVKDRLGIIVLSYGSGQLSISKEVTDTKEEANLKNEWVFDVTITSADSTAMGTPFNLSWTDLEGNPLEGREPKTITFTNKTDNTYTAQIVIKSGEKVTIEQLPDDAKYTVSETRSEQYVGFTDDYKYRTFVGNTSYETYSASGTAAPDTHIHFINQFPSAELPSAGGSGVKWYIIIGSALTVFSGVMYLYLYRRRKPAFKAHRRI